MSVDGARGLSGGGRYDRQRAGDPARVRYGPDRKTGYTDDTRPATYSRGLTMLTRRPGIWITLAGARPFR